MNINKNEVVMHSITSNTNYAFPEFPSAATPSISKETIEIFNAHNFVPPGCIVSLKGKVEDFEKTQTRLADAKEHSTRDKIISLLATALAIGILAGGALGTYYGCTMGGAPIGTVGAVVTWLISFALTEFYNDKWSDYEYKGVIPSSGYADGFILPIIGPFIPVWKTFGNISRYEKSSEQKSKEIQRDVEEVKKFFSENHANSTRLLNLLEEGIAQTQSSLEAVKALPIKSAESELALSSKLAQLKKVLGELETTRAFFSEE
jgi:hypothetical protein